MSSARVPPRFIPTLTEVVDDLPHAPVMAARPTTPEPTMGVTPARAPEPAPVLSPEAQDELTRRVLERVAQSLEPLLADTVSAIARQHSVAMTQHLAETVEDVVSGLVAEAVQAELASRRGL